MLGVGTCMCLFSNLMIFKADYSLIGHLIKTPVPSESPLLEETTTKGHIGIFFGRRGLFRPNYTWWVFRSGLGIKTFVGQGFIPFSCFKSLRKEGGFVVLGTRYYLEHESPEIRGPIYLPNENVFNALQLAYDEYKKSTASV